MISEQLTTLEDWAKSRYGTHVPTRDTLRRWAREGRIFPAPQKHGRTYFVAKDAQYVDNYNDSEFMRKVRESTQTQ